MSEALSLPRFEERDDESALTPHLAPVPEAEGWSSIVAAEEDETGRVIAPAIDLETGDMPNGQSIRSFYERGGERHPGRLARHALAEAHRAHAAESATLGSL